MYFCRSYFSLCEESLFVQLYMCDSLQGLGLICVFDFHYSNRSFILMLNHLDVISVTMEVQVPGLKTLINLSHVIFGYLDVLS